MQDNSPQAIKTLEKKVAEQLEILSFTPGQISLIKELILLEIMKFEHSKH